MPCCLSSWTLGPGVRRQQQFEYTCWTVTIPIVKVQWGSLYLLGYEEKESAHHAAVSQTLLVSGSIGR